MSYNNNIQDNQIIYYGELRCQGKLASGKNCKNGAYYFYNNLYLCGVHSKSNQRTELPKQNKEEKEEKQKEEYKQKLEVINKIQYDNFINKCKGRILICRLGMMKKPSHFYGYLNVYPNEKDGGRKDGFGCPSLSPKVIGPVNHGQPNLPPSKNLENFHQSNKVFREEVDEFKNPTSLFYENRLRFYLDNEPHRHKYTSASRQDKSLIYRGTKENPNIPFYSLWVDKTGKEHRLTYVESRQFYCNFYERAVSLDKSFLYLKDLVDKGLNIVIYDYDGYGMNTSFERRNEHDTSYCMMYNIEKDYLDSRSPYGHGKVLYAMLMLKPEQYPWIKYKTFDF
jgi:hypothetical protein